MLRGHDPRCDSDRCCAETVLCSSRLTLVLLSVTAALLASSFSASRRSSTAQAVPCQTLRTTPPRAACCPRLPRKSRRVAMSSSRAAPALLSGDAYSRASAASQTYVSRVSVGKHLARVLQAMLDVDVCPCTLHNSARLLSSLRKKNTAEKKKNTADDTTECKLEFVPTLTNYFDVGRGLVASRVQWASKLPCVFVFRAAPRTGQDFLPFFIYYSPP